MKAQAWLYNTNSIKINYSLYLFILIWLGCNKSPSNVREQPFRFEVEPLNYAYVVQFSDTSSVNPDLMYNLFFRNLSLDTLSINMYSVCHIKVGIVQAYRIERQFNNWSIIPLTFLDSNFVAKTEISPETELSFPVFLGVLRNGDCVLIQPQIDFPPQYIRLPAFGGPFAFVREPFAFFRYLDDTTDIFSPEFEDCTDSMTVEIRKSLGE